MQNKFHTLPLPLKGGEGWRSREVEQVGRAGTIGCAEAGERDGGVGEMVEQGCPGVLVADGVMGVPDFHQRRDLPQVVNVPMGFGLRPHMMPHSPLHPTRAKGTAHIHIPPVP